MHFIHIYLMVKVHYALISGTDQGKGGMESKIPLLKVSPSF